MSYACCPECEDDALYLNMDEDDRVDCGSCGFHFDPTLYTAAELGLDPEEDEGRW